MDMEKLLTKEKADAICGQIAKGLEENKIVGSTNVIAYAMKQSWFAGFEEGRKYAPQEIEVGRPLVRRLRRLLSRTLPSFAVR